MASIETFTLAIPDNKLELLSLKLSTASFPDELDEAKWDYGAPLAEIKRLTEYWKDKYDWRKQESEINKLPNFRTSIHVDGFGALDIHFLHQKSDVENAIPLLFVHGCILSCSLLFRALTHHMQGLATFLKSPSSFPY